MKIQEITAKITKISLSYKASKYREFMHLMFEVFEKAICSLVNIEIQYTFIFIFYMYIVYKINKTFIRKITKIFLCILTEYNLA